MVNSTSFRNALIEKFKESQKQGLAFIDIRSGDLHKELGDYPGPNSRMPVCCSVMRGLIDSGDIIVKSPLKGNGANLIIRYNIPRNEVKKIEQTHSKKSQEISSEDLFVKKIRELSTKHLDLSELKTLDKLMKVDPQSAMVKIRTVSEKICYNVCRKQNIPCNNTTFVELCNIISDNQILSKKSMNYLHSIRKMGNVFAHPSHQTVEKISEHDVMIMANELCAIVDECLDEKLI
jgi:hypothetical protein